MTYEEITRRFDGANGTYKCPAHDDRNASLSISRGKDGKILLHCHAGCKTSDILKAVDLTFADISPQKSRNTPKPKRRIAAIYDYPNAQKIRYEPKSFAWRHKGANGEWIYNRRDVPHDLYIRGNEQQTMFFVEGEKDVDNLSALGFYVCCNEDGADKHGKGKWFDAYNESFRSKDVRIIIDNDEAGRNFSQFVASKLLDIATSIKLFDLKTVWNDCPEHGDISDMFSALGKEATLKAIDELEVNTLTFKDDLPVAQIEDTPKELPSFYRDGKFLHNVLGDYLIDNYGVCFINGGLHVYDNGVYISGTDAIQGITLELLPELSAAKRKEVYEYLKVSRKTPKRELSAPNFIPFKSKIYDLETDSFLDYNDGFVFLNRFPYDYNPKAKYCASIANVINDIADGDSEILELISQAFGNCFYMVNSFRGAVFLYGRNGNNGKSTLLNMLIQLLGRENVSNLSLQDTAAKFRLIEMYGKAANIGDDIPSTYFPDSSLFKKLVTGESVMAEKKGKDPVTFCNYAKIFFALNELPPVKDRTEAFFSRVILVPMEHDFSNCKNAGLKDKHWSDDEMTWLTMFAMDGLKTLIKTGDFIKPSKVLEALSDYEKENDPVLLFIDETELTDIVDRPTADVYSDFRLWCERNGHINIPAKISFSRRIVSRLRIVVRVEKHRGKTAKYYRAIDY